MGRRNHDQGRHRSGSSYASVMLTADHGVRMQSDFATDRAGSASSGTRWLRLARAGDTITGYESADGTTWPQIGTATPRNLPATAEVGFYVSSAARAVHVARRRQLVGRGTPDRRRRHLRQCRPRRIRAMDAVSRSGTSRRPRTRQDKGGPPGGAPFRVAATASPSPAPARSARKLPDDDIVETRADRRHRRAHGPDLRRRPFATVRVPPGHDPHHVRGHAPTRPGAGGQGHRPRNGHVRRQPGRCRGRSWRWRSPR